MNPGKHPNKSHHSSPSLLAPAWTASRLFFVGGLSLGVLVLFLLVPPTTVQADRQHNLQAAAGTNPETITSDVIADESFVAHPKTTLTLTAQASSISAGFVPVQENTSQTEMLSDPAATIATEKEIEWNTVKVGRGDTLTHMFKKAGLQAKDAYELLGRCAEAKRLSRIHPGHELDFHIEDQQLQTLRYRKSVLESQIYTRDQERFVAETIIREPNTRVRYQKASLQDSLFLAGKRAGLDQNIIMQLANVFGGVIDFVFDPRKGDTFSIMYEDLYLDGKKIGTGNILAAEYINDGDAFTAYRYEDKKGNAGYYAPDGVSMQKAFLRAPLDFKRISSNFNPRRRHPIHKSIRAHRGIDYAAPRGTPVFAAGDGRVTKAGYSRANGNFIVVSHGPQYTTKYLHLTKRHVKRLSKVKKGQIIGTVGSTGYATGPHLHYEFLVNGVHRNPRTILNKLPKAKSIAKTEMPRFKESIASLEVKLAKHQQAYQLAQLNTGSYTLVEPRKSDAGH